MAGAVGTLLRAGSAVSMAAKETTPRRSFWRLRWFEVVTVARSFRDERIPRKAAALSYYTVFSLAPLLVIAVAIVGLIFGEEAARGRIVREFRSLIGESGGEAIAAMVEHSRELGANLTATTVGLVTLFFGATGVFAELQDSLNAIWKTRVRAGKGIRSFVRRRLLSFSMVFGIGFLLLASLLLSSGIAAAGAWLHGDELAQTFTRWSDFLLSFLIIGFLFAGSYKFLPDVAVRWRHVWLGAALGSFAFAIGKYLISLYLGQSALASTYGSLGAVAVLLIWIYYSSQIFLLGALYTRAHALAAGAELRPVREAEWAEPTD